MWGMNSKIWYVISALWLIAILSNYLKTDVSVENINSLLNIFTAILVTASVGIGAMAYVFIKSSNMKKILDMVIVLIFMSVSSAIIAHTDNIMIIDNVLWVKKIQLFIDVLVLSTSLAFISGYLDGTFFNKDNENKINVQNNNKAKRHSKK